MEQNVGLGLAQHSTAQQAMPRAAKGFEGTDSSGAVLSWSGGEAVHAGSLTPGAGEVRLQCPGLVQSTCAVLANKA